LLNAQRLAMSYALRVAIWTFAFPTSKQPLILSVIANPNNIA
jgi:hypothetical protein